MTEVKEHHLDQVILEQRQWAGRVDAALDELHTAIWGLAQAGGTGEWVLGQLGRHDDADLELDRTLAIGESIKLHLWAAVGELQARWVAVRKRVLEDAVAEEVGRCHS
jgi:hypothetical protein